MGWAIFLLAWFALALELALFMGPRLREARISQTQPVPSGRNEGCAGNRAGGGGLTPSALTGATPVSNHTFHSSPNSEARQHDPE